MVLGRNGGFMRIFPLPDDALIVLSREEDTQALGRELALFLKPGDWVFLEGDLGAGKTTLARALIRALARDPGLVVTSPTFPLLQVYQECTPPVAHYDLYRLSSGEVGEDLEMEDRACDVVSVVEWPDRWSSPPPSYLKVVLSGENPRRAHLLGYGSWSERLERFFEVRNFLTMVPGTIQERSSLPMDASTRRYERVMGPRGSFILMDMPPPVEPLCDVLAISFLLAQHGISSPKPSVWSFERGLLIQEDLGAFSYTHMLKMATEKEEQALVFEVVDLLSDLACIDWSGPHALPWTHRPYILKRYTHERALEEALLFWQWYVPLFVQKEGKNQAFCDAFTEGYSALKDPYATLVLRDVHCDNLLWQGDRQGTARVGVIDTQDALLGHRAYDLVSLLQDARMDFSENLEEKGVERYLNRALAEDPSCDVQGFLRDYAFWGAQRALKILGVFSRLSVRDGKHGYLKHIPRVKERLRSNLKNPALASWKKIVEGYL